MKTFELLRRHMYNTIKAEDEAKKDPFAQGYLYEQAKMLNLTIGDIFEEVYKSGRELNDLAYDELYSLISAVHICNRIIGDNEVDHDRADDLLRACLLKHVIIPEEAVDELDVLIKDIEDEASEKNDILKAYKEYSKYIQKFIEEYDAISKWFA